MAIEIVLYLTEYLVIILVHTLFVSRLAGRRRAVPG